MDLDTNFPDRIRIYWSIRIRTQEKKSDADPDKKTRIRDSFIFLPKINITNPAGIRLLSSVEPGMVNVHTLLGKPKKEKETNLHTTTKS